jgi:RNase P/RNase MRP subunit POP5
MLRRRSKRRYFAIQSKLSLSQGELTRVVEQRFTELFGNIATQFAYLRSYRSKHQGILILGCDLEYVEQILFTLALLHYPITCIAMSGTLRRLRKGLDEFNYSPNP